VAPQYNRGVVYGETRQTQARRWAKFPATVLFVLSVLWLLRSFFDFGNNPQHFQGMTHTGIGILQVLWDLLVIPVGGAVVGIYLLLRKRWAAPVAALLPLEPLVIATLDKVTRVTTQFHNYNVGGQLDAAGNGMNHLLQILAFWTVYAFMLINLWKVWTLLKSRPQWASTSGGSILEDPSPAAQQAVRNADGDVCFLLPETEDVESA